MNKGINWQRAVATEGMKHCGLLYPGHTNRLTDGADSSTQGPFPFFLLQYPPTAPSDLHTQFHSIQHYYSSCEQDG
jgi:hypothetical protein